MINFTNKNPSEEYLKNIDFYKEIHKKGYQSKKGHFVNNVDAYHGGSTREFAKVIKKIIEKNQIKNMLDYGCGKGFFYDNSFYLKDEKIEPLKKFWNIDIDLYDPCYKKYSHLSTDKIYDLIICIDVLEHVPRQDINWLLNKIFAISKKYVFINLACYYSNALLPDGSNAHINVNDKNWWFDKILKFKKKYSHLKIICVCSYLLEDKRIELIPLQFDDDIKNYLD
tara:strand:- start:1138 stop:1812 length:675 start_codon:yes stop_codon:yes gene_type:complete